MCGHSEVVLMLEVRGGWQTMLMMISPWACRSTLPSMPERRIRYLVAFSWGAVFRRLPRATQSELRPKPCSAKICGMGFVVYWNFRTVKWSRLKPEQ